MAQYPGDGQRMSNYGRQELTPEEAAGQWKETTKRQLTIHKGHLAIKGNGTAVWPGVSYLPQHHITHPASFFGNTTQEGQEAAPEQPSNNHFHYDRMFHIEQGYNSKLHRDDRQHTVGLDIQREELQRSIPVRSSTEYGHRVDQPLEGADRIHVRIDKVMKGFYRTRGTGIPTSLDREPNSPS